MVSIVKTFDLYNTTFFWNGYTVPGFETELKITNAYYIAQFSSNPIGSQIDFFAELAGQINQNPTFNINNGTTAITAIDTLPYLWGKYWWDEATYYTATVVYNAISNNYPQYYQPFSECIGSLYNLSRYNNLQNTQTSPYNTIMNTLLTPAISSAINGFYSLVNSMFVSNISAIGPHGTDTAPNNSNLIMADTDLTRSVAAVTALTATINTLYPKLFTFLPFNTNVIGNLITPYNWFVTMPYEDQIIPGDGTILVDQTNSPIAAQVQLCLSALQV